MTQETEEERIERRSQNAEAVVSFLDEAYNWFWIVAGVLVGLVFLAFWLLG